MNITLAILAAALAAFTFSANVIHTPVMWLTQDSVNINPSSTKTIQPRPFPGVFVQDSAGNPVPLSITKLDVQVQILGTTATTTIDMTVYNPHGRVLEGEFSFPVADGQTVSRFALDINGRLREAVVVSKSKGRSTFEEVIRTKVDPALLEWTRDNSFRTRIYPLPARGTRRVVIAYEQQLTSIPEGFGYTIPFAFPEAIHEFTFHAMVAGFGKQPSLTGAPAQAIAFTPQGRTFIAELAETDILVNVPFTINVPVVLNQHQVVVQSQNNEDFAGIFLSMNPEQRQRTSPKTITVFWDASISGLKRDVNKELLFLEQVISAAKPSQIDLVVFANAIMHRERYTGSDAQALLRRLRSIPMDGGTQLGIVPFASVHADMGILFSDGISTFGAHQPIAGTMPIVTIASSAQADHAILRNIAKSTGGEFVNLFTMDVQGAVAYALMDRLAIRRIDVVDGQIDELRPTGIIPVDQVTAITGKLRTSSATVRITTSIGQGNEHVETISINANEHHLDGASIPRLWATQELQRLSMDRVRNADAITALGQRFSIVTPGSSLIVLERIEDYLRFDIEPPASEPELQSMFADQRANALQQQAAQQSAHKKSVLAMLVGAHAPEPLATSGSRFWLWPASQDVPSNVSRSELATVSGSVRDVKGNPIAGSVVTIQGTPLVANTSADGRFTIANVPSGAVQLVSSHAAYASSRTSLVAKPQQLVTTTVTLTTTPSVKRSTAKVKSASLSHGEGPPPDQLTRGGHSDRNAAVTIQSQGEGLSEQATDIGSVSARGSRVQRASPTTEIEVTERGSIVDYAPANAMAAPEPQIVILHDRMQVVQGVIVELEADTLYDIVAPQHESSGIVTAVQRDQWTEDIAKAPSQSIYQKYLELRPTYFDVTGFYLDVADALIAAKQPELALRVLSSLAELQGEDSRTLRILAHRLMQLKLPDLAVMIFEDVQRVRDEEPQSYRDLGLALAACGRLEEAADKFTYVIEHPWDNRFPEVELIAARELSFIANAQNMDRHRIDTNYLVPYRNDIRVVLTWDADNCDMDLWVTDPDGERCLYSHRDTKMGGHLSHDLVGGLGPEEFILPRAKKGAYKIQVHYYGDRQQDIERPTTIQVELFARYGMKDEQHDAVTMRVNGVQRVIDAGRILVN